MRNGEGADAASAASRPFWALGALRALGSAIANPAPISRLISIAANHRQTGNYLRRRRVPDGCLRCSGTGPRAFGG
jgi:hypothetical protein